MRSKTGTGKSYLLLNLAGYVMLAVSALFSSFYHYPGNRYPLAIALICGFILIGHLIIIILENKIAGKASKLLSSIIHGAGILIVLPLLLSRLARLYPGYLLRWESYNRALYLEAAGFLFLAVLLILSARQIFNRAPQEAVIRNSRLIGLGLSLSFALLYGIWTLLQVNPPLPERIGSYQAPGTSAPMRMEVSVEKPLFIFNIYGWDDASVRWLHENLPADVRPYWAIQFVSLTKDTPEDREGVEKVLSICDELDFNAFIQIEHCLSDSDVPTEYLDYLFAKHHSLAGLAVAEFSAANTSFYGMDYSHFGVISAALDLAGTHGAYLMWQDMGYEFRHPFSMAGSNKALYEKLTAHGEHVLLVDKRNGRSKRQLGPSSAMGFYLTDKIDGWGINSEGWIWWEAGLGPIGKEPVGITKAHRMWEAMFTYPDSIFGIEWLMAAAGGATVYSLEAPFQGFAALWENKSFLPAWHEVILPLSRKIISEDLIATKEEMRGLVKAAYLPDRVMPAEYGDDDLFKGLYGPEQSSLYEWLPSTGRYYFLPVLPQLTAEEDLKQFENIITSKQYSQELHSRDKKKERFDSIYPSFYKGDAWAVEIGNTWYLANPEENLQKEAVFSIRTGTAEKAELIEGALSPNGFAIIDEKDGETRIYLNNFRMDSDETIWSYTDDKWDLKVFLDGNIGGFNTNRFDPREYAESLAASPSTDCLRESRIRIITSDSGEKSVDVAVTRGSFNIEKTANSIDITVLHNGEVDIRLGD